LQIRRLPPSELFAAAADAVAEAAARNREVVLGLPTDEDSLELYRELARRKARGEVDLSKAWAFVLDEVLSPPAEAGKAWMALEPLCADMGLTRSRCEMPDRAPGDPDIESQRFGAAILGAGGFDLVVATLGREGRVGRIEAGAAPTAHVVRTEGSSDSESRCSITVGMAALKKARSVRLLALDAAGQGSAEVLAAGPVPPVWPVAALHDHPDLEVLAKS
jgi:glucosamine-6-phosphate deaminase